MSKNHHGGPAPVPPGNRPQAGHSDGPADEEGRTGVPDAEGTGFAEQDPQRRLGDYEGKGEHSIQQPSPRNDGGHGGHLGRSKS